MSKKQDIRNIVLFVLIGIVLFGIVGYKAYKDFHKESVAEKKIMSLDLYGYSLGENDSKLYKDNFKALETILNEKPIKYEEYAKTMSKLFVIDVFTLSNKVSSTDIGGLEFIYKDLKENFKENMGATLYKNIEINLDGKRKQTLPEVTSIEATDIKEHKYTYNKKEYDGYIVTLKWQYKQDLGYMDSIRLTLIKDDNKLYVVRGE